MRAKSLEFLENLIETPTPSGHEAPGQKIWREYIEPYVDQIESDAPLAEIHGRRSRFGHLG